LTKKQTVTSTFEENNTNKEKISVSHNEIEEEEIPLNPVSQKFKNVLEKVDNYAFITEIPHTIKIKQNAPKKFERIKQILDFINTVTRENA